MEHSWLRSVELGIKTTQHRTPNGATQVCLPQYGRLKSIPAVLDNNSGLQNSRPKAPRDRNRYHDKWYSKTSAEHLDERLALSREHTEANRAAFKDWCESEHAIKAARSLQRKENERKKMLRAKEARRIFKYSSHSAATKWGTDPQEDPSIKEWCNSKAKLLRQQKAAAKAEAAAALAAAEKLESDRALLCKERVRSLREATATRSKRKIIKRAQQWKARMSNPANQSHQQERSQSNSSLVSSQSSSDKLMCNSRGSACCGGSTWKAVTKGAGALRICTWQGKDTDQAVLSKTALRSQSARQLMRLTGSPLHVSVAQFYDTDFLNTALKHVTRQQGNTSCSKVRPATAPAHEHQRQKSLKQVCNHRLPRSGGPITPRKRRNLALHRSARNARKLCRTYSGAYPCSATGGGVPDVSMAGTLTSTGSKTVTTAGPPTDLCTRSFNSELPVGECVLDLAVGNFNLTSGGNAVDPYGGVGAWGGKIVAKSVKRPWLKSNERSERMKAKARSRAVAELNDNG